MHSIVIDLGFGDAGKGSIVDALARWNHNTSAVVRFNGGAQAAHNVVTDDGRHHTFAQFGSGTFVDGVRTFLGPEFMLNPSNLWREAEALDFFSLEPMKRLSIHPDALIITPYHQLLNQKTAAHGTTGQGIGETMKDSLLFDDSQVIRARDMLDGRSLVRKYMSIKARKIGEATKRGVSLLTPGGDVPDKEFFMRCMWIASMGCVRDNLRELAADGHLIFEGAQGVLIDQDLGFHPHTTWSDTTHRNAVRLLRSLGPDVGWYTIGVMRAYQVRHGAGPFVTEKRVPAAEPHNRSDGWAGEFRTGHLDLVALRYALSVCPAVALALTHMDKVSDTIQVCDSYQYRGSMPDLDPYFERDGNAIVGIKRSPNPDSSHAHMEAVTNRLFDMGAVLSSVAREKLVETIEEKLGPRVTIISDSPTFSGKKMVRMEVAA